jgi:hypothetical protein
MNCKPFIKIVKKRVEDASWRMVLASFDKPSDLIDENRSISEDLDKEKNLAHKHCGDARVL